MNKNIAMGIVILGIALFVVGAVGYLWFWGNCPAYLVYRSQQEYDDVLNVLQLADAAGMEQPAGPLPDSYIINLRAARDELGLFPTPLCLKSARESLYTAIDSAISYYANRSWESGGPDDNYKWKTYQSWRKDYQDKQNKVQACYPLCNLGFDPLTILAPAAQPK